LIIDNHSSINKKSASGGFFVDYQFFAIPYGISAKKRARLTACAIWRWCVAQAPVFFLGRILPVPEVKCRRISVSLKSIVWMFF